MSFRTFKYSIRQGIKNIGRNRMYSLASIATITASLFIMGILFFVIINFHSIIQSAESSVGVTIFFEEGISQTRIEEIGLAIEQKQEVESIEFISGEQMWERYKEEYLSDELVESFGDDNPLKDSDSYTVYLHDTSYQDTIVEYIESLDGVRSINYSETIADTFSDVSSIFAIISVAIIIILISVSVFLINSSITMGIAARKEEISIMKLLGSTNSFISAPFVIEGLIIGIVGSLIPLTVLYLIYDKIIIYISENYTNVFQMVKFVELDDVFRILTPIILIIGIGIGFLGSFITVKRQIQQVEVS